MSTIASCFEPSLEQPSVGWWFFASNRRINDVHLNQREISSCGFGIVSNKPFERGPCDWKADCGDNGCMRSFHCLIGEEKDG